ncbi:MAG: hypothetical protein WA463_01635 [Terriglobales bacterium]
MPEFSHEQLLELYKIAIEEYRFQVRLNWDRTAYQLTLNSGLIAIAVGLMKIGSAPLLNLFVGGIFLVGLAAAVVGIQNVLRGHRYYRNTIVKKTLLEDQLGLTKPVEKYEAGLTMGVGTTTGQNEQIQILHNTERWLRRPLRGTITYWIVCILILFLTVNALGVAGSLWLYWHPIVTSQSAD